MAKSTLGLAGWAFEGDVPQEKKFVALAVPHTSNWDGVLLLLLTRSIGLPIRWMVKDSWVRGPLKPFMLEFGAVPIDRSRASNVVDQMIDCFRREESFVLFVPPEGTRSRAEYWKSGFYHIALGANVPIIPAYVDFGAKRGGFGPAFHPTGDVRVDMDRIRAFYEQRRPKPRAPEKFGPIRLRDETEVGPAVKSP